MGIHNRDYLNPTTLSNESPQNRVSVIAKIICVTVAVFLLQTLTAQPAPQDSLVFEWLALERDLTFESGHIWRLLTYAFCHSEHQITHIVCNMLALFFAGRIVAQKLGDREFLMFYLTSAVFAGVVQVCSMAVFRSPGPAWALGASGAVCSVFMLFAMYYPKMKLYLFGAIPVQARWLLIALVAYDILGFLGLAPRLLSGNGATVAHAAHLGGLAFGFLYFQSSMNLSSWWDNFAGRARSTDELEPTGAALKVFNPGFQPEVNYSERIDEILEKISREGRDSLTAREIRVLNQASEHLSGNR